jgi:hypothetical protein
MDELAPPKHSPLCPQCGGADTFRSQRRGFIEWIFHYLLIQSPYRCQECNERFFHHRLARPHKKQLHHRPV